MADSSYDHSKTRIDVHAHAFPPEFMKTLRSKPSRSLDIRTNWQWDESRFLAEMDRWQVSMQVLSLPHVYEYYDPENRADGVELCRCVNDEYGEICARGSERFRFFAAAPLPDVEAMRGTRSRENPARILRYLLKHKHPRTNFG